MAESQTISDYVVEQIKAEYKNRTELSLLVHTITSA